jgi:hypothetical protein
MRPEFWCIRGPATKPGSEWSRAEFCGQTEQAICKMENFDNDTHCSSAHRALFNMLSQGITATQRRHRSTPQQKGRRTAMLISQASRRRARRHRSAALFGHAHHDSRLPRKRQAVDGPIAASASSSAAGQTIDLVRGDCKAAALATVSCVDPVKGDSKTETYHQKIITLLVPKLSKDYFIA